MTARTFTTTWLNTLAKKPPSERTYYSETGRRGFMLRHFEGGTLTFFVRYKFGGRSKTITIGNYPARSLAEAHDAHTAIRKQIDNGLDPLVERERETREAAKAAHKKATVDAVTVRNVIAEWAWHYARKHRKRPLEAVRLLKTHLLVPALEGLPAADIRKRDLVVIIDKITGRRANVMANRMRALVAQIFTFAAERDLIEMSPATGLTKQPGGEEKPRKRSLNREEVAVVWRKLATPARDPDDRRKLAKGESPITHPLRLALKLILVTGQRPGEVCNAYLSEFDMKARVWTIPPVHIKTEGKVKDEDKAQPHWVPITDTAAAIIEELRELGSGRARLLPGKHRIKNPTSAVDHRALSQALRDSYEGKPPKLWGLKLFKPNDLRRTVATHLGALGFSRFDQDRILNHADDTIGAVYDQHTYWDEKVKALTAWETELKGIVAGDAPKVINIAHARRA